ncbi:MAG: transcriptional activator NhaR [Pseudomonadota bacterium]
MRQLNYTHLLYFWSTAQAGSIARAAQTLHITPQTISGQLKLLEEAIGEPLFDRVGRGLTLTDTGRFVKQYADEIFQLGNELTQSLKSKQGPVPKIIQVGVLMSIPKLLAQQAMEPALHMPNPVRIVCHEGDLDKLLGELATHKLDLIISDRPLPSGSAVRAFNHPLGESSISLFAHKSIARQFRRFPQDLDDAPVLLPIANNTLRRNLEDWFERQSVAPRTVAEFDDAALMKAFAQAGHGVFPAPTNIADEVCQMYDAKLLGQMDGVKERYYAISPERRVKHPAVLSITESAKA